MIKLKTGEGQRSNVVEIEPLLSDSGEEHDITKSL